MLKLVITVRGASISFEGEAPFSDVALLADKFFAVVTPPDPKAIHEQAERLDHASDPLKAAVDAQTP